MEEKEPKQNLNTTGNNKKKNGKKFLWMYATALFSVALILIFVSYVTQIASQNELAALNKKLYSDLETTEGALKKALTLEDVNKKLQDELSSVQADYEKLQSDLKDLEEQFASSERGFLEAKANAVENDNCSKAYEQMWKLENAYRTKKYSTARKIISEMEKQKLNFYLHDDAAAAYKKIKDRLL